MTCALVNPEKTVVTCESGSMYGLVLPSSLTAGDHTRSPDADLKDNTHERERERESQINLVQCFIFLLRRRIFFLADRFPTEDPVYKRTECEGSERNCESKVNWHRITVNG